MNETTFYSTYMSDLASKDTRPDKIKDLAIAAADYLRSKSGELLPTVHIRGTNQGYYWSPASKRHILVPKRAEYYLLPWKKDEKGRNYLFLPCFLTNGVVICVDPDEIDYLGMN